MKQLSVKSPSVGLLVASDSATAWTTLGSAVPGILQARILEWIAISHARGPFPPRDRTVSPASPALADRFFTTAPPEKGASLVAQLVKNPPAMQETSVQFLVREDPLEKG